MRKTSTAQLFDQSGQLQSLDCIATPILLLDRRGFFASYNREFARLVGITSTYAPNNLFDVIAAEDQPRVAELLLQSHLNYSREKYVGIESVCGDRISVDIMTHAQSGESIVATFINQTELRKTEEQRDELIRIANHHIKMAELGELTGNLAHELNNPLSIVIGYAELANEIAKQSVEPKKLVDKLAKVINSGHRIANAVHAMMRFAREDNGLFEMQDLATIVSDVLTLVRAKAEKSQIEIITELNPAPIFGNRAQIQQIVMNLFNNATSAVKKSSADDLQIKFFTGIDPISGERQIVVSNNGPEIPAKMCQEIFTPLRAANDYQPGQGIGLSIASHFMNNHRGTIQVTSQKEETEFNLRFPDSRFFLPPEEAAGVMVLADCHDLQMELKSQFAEPRYQYYQVAKEEEALELLSKTSCHFVIVELQFADLNSFQLIKRIKAMSPRSITIAMNPFEDINSRFDDAKRLCADAFFSKPLSIEKITRYIEKTTRTLRNHDDNQS